MVISRMSLRTQVRAELLERIRTGALQPGERINELQLAAELGVSRTPLREALIALEADGLVTSSNGRGFRTLALSARELEELAPILGALEPLARELTPAEALPALGAELARIAAEFGELTAHAQVQAKDDEWHRRLLSHCDNARLLETIEGLRTVFHRYEAVLVTSDAVLERVEREHAEIAQLVAAGDVRLATAALRANWLAGSRRLRRDGDAQPSR